MRIFQFHVGDGHGSHIASCARKGHPRRRRVFTRRGEQIEGGIGDGIDDVRPVGEGRRERGSEAIGLGRVEIVEAIRNGLAVALAIDAGERGDDVVGSVRDEGSVVVYPIKLLA